MSKRLIGAAAPSILQLIVGTYYRPNADFSQHESSQAVSSDDLALFRRCDARERLCGPRREPTPGLQLTKIVRQARRR